MKELFPTLLGFCFGSLTAIASRPSRRAALAVGITGCIALAAFLTSGEFRESWAYALLDLLEVAVGFAAGSIVARRYGINRSSVRR